ncbi:hypothetical protein ACIBG8_38215 [Nonomuraea sp. NPDC050556]|uniref:hypothetical protein n=1 Tax=Nonomuraea sp. NPDC050556 TaxID=3364369 RepID=UPI0037A0CE98
MSVEDVVRACVGDPRAEVAEQHEEHVASGALSTAALRRLHGTTKDGVPWSFVVKSIMSMKHWEGMDMVPEHLREAAVAHFPWRADADVYLCPPPLPPGFRLPVLYLMEDLGDDRMNMWMEDVDAARDGWDLTRYRRAARLLGELASLRPARGPNLGMRYYIDGPLRNAFLPLLRDPATWRHPLVAEHADPLLRADLLSLAERIEPLMAALDRLPHTMPHGDACPQNLLVPTDGSADFVAIDWGWPHAAPVGFDLGQLLVGLAQAGATDPEDLPAIHETIEAAYLGQVDADPADVSFGYVASLVLRSAWQALPLERLGEEVTPELEQLFARRAALARFIVDLGRGL